MSESTNIQRLNKSFENSNYSSPVLSAARSFFRCVRTITAHFDKLWVFSLHVLCITMLSMVTVIPSIQPRHCLSYNHLPHALSSSFKPYAARSFFPCVRTITAQFDKLYWQTLFPFQLFFSPVHSSVNVD